MQHNNETMATTKQKKEDLVQAEKAVGQLNLVLVKRAKLLMR